jgi:hypothetical protein
MMATVGADAQVLGEAFPVQDLSATGTFVEDVTGHVPLFIRRKGLLVLPKPGQVGLLGKCRR